MNSIKLNYDINKVIKKILNYFYTNSNVLFLGTLFKKINTTFIKKIVNMIKIITLFGGKEYKKYHQYLIIITFLLLSTTGLIKGGCN